MINKQLLEYTKTQLASDTSREEIVKTLSLNGLSEPEITELFTAATSPENPSAEEGAAQDTPTQTDKVASSLVPPVIGRSWTKIIPRSNQVTMALSLLLVFGLDLTILISAPELFAFWAIMLAVMTIFAVFFYLENYTYKPKFALSVSKLDPWITTLVIVRNVVFILNFIPFIQILGAIALAIGGIPYLIAYGILVHMRGKEAHVN